MRSAEDDADAVTLGACVTHAAIEDGRVADPSRGLMPRVAATLAYRAIRTRGTIGGSLALSDPAGRMAGRLRRPRCRRHGLWSETGGARSNAPSLRPGSSRPGSAADEIVEGVRIPKLSADAPLGLSEAVPQNRRVRQRTGGRRRRSGAAAIRGSSLGAANGAPLVLNEPRGSYPPMAAATFASAVAVDLDRAADRNFDAFQRNLHTVAAMRAVQQVAP